MQRSSGRTRTRHGNERRHDGDSGGPMHVRAVDRVGLVEHRVRAEAERGRYRERHARVTDRSAESARRTRAARARVPQRPVRQVAHLDFQLRQRRAYMRLRLKLRRHTGRAEATSPTPAHCRSPSNPPAILQAGP